MQKSKSQIGDMPKEDFKKYGHQLIDWIADFLDTIEEKDVLTQMKPNQLVAQLPESAPEESEPFEAILEDVNALIMPAMTHWNHPKFLAYFASSAGGPGILGELLASAFNVNGMVWKSSPASTELEQVVMNWLRQLLGLPQEFWGLIYDTASMSSFHGLAAACEKARTQQKLERGEKAGLFRFYASEHAHSSIDKAIITLGFPLTCLRKIKTNSYFEMDASALEQAIEQDRKAGHIPVAVVSTIGTTSVASIDPATKISSICQRQNLWHHVDAAFGGAAAFLPEKRHFFEGWQHADSIVMNPHKWLFVPIDFSAFFTKHPDILRDAFSIVPEYLRTKEDGAVRHQMDYGVQLGRRFRSLKMWFTLRSFGAEGMRARIRHNFTITEKLQMLLAKDERFELVAPVHLPLVCFQITPKSGDANQFNEEIMQSINETGKFFISHTKIDGKFVIRVALNHLRTTEEHIEEFYKLLCETIEAHD